MRFVLSIMSVALFSAMAQERPSVRITQGTVLGSIADDGDYFAFFGIPYADSPSGVNRFKAPGSPPQFEEHFVAENRDIKCIHAVKNGFEGTENCLVANVFTPNVTSGAGLPVMVWVKGIEFDNEPLELTFKNFIAKNVIVVSINFRESIFGYLCLGTEVAPGNAGLKDIIAGLRWVKENIEAFGGDPDNVSIFGHGTGASAVDLITLSPMATGLINRAISQSGTAMAPWAVTRDNLKYAVLVAEALGHEVTDTAQLSEIFTRTSTTALMAIINELDLTDNSLAFAPCVERELEGVEAFLLKSPYQIITDGEMLPIPFMTGYAEYEGTIRVEEAINNNWLQRMETSFEDFLQPDLYFSNNEERDFMADMIKQFYFGDSSVDITEYLSYMGDVMIHVSAIWEARLRAAVSIQPLYLYEFSYKGKLGEPFHGPIELDGAVHSEELAYLFSDPADNVIFQDQQVSDILIERWTNFAKNGVPTSQSSPMIWMSFTSLNQAILLIDDRVDSTLEIVLTNPRSEEMTFWGGVYDSHFLDATSDFVIDDEGSEDIVVTTAAAVTDREDEDTVTVTDEPESVTTESAGVDESEGSGEEDNVPDSASTAVSYTFSIITIFGFLNKFHSKLLMI